MHRDTDHAAEMAAAQGVRSADLMAAGIVDRVVPEPEDPAAERDEFCRRLGAALHDEVARVITMVGRDRRALRRNRYRRLGNLPGC